MARKRVLLTGAAAYLEGGGTLLSPRNRQPRLTR